MQSFSHYPRIKLHKHLNESQKHLVFSLVFTAEQPKCSLQAVGTEKGETWEGEQTTNSLQALSQPQWKLPVEILVPADKLVSNCELVKWKIGFPRLANLRRTNRPECHFFLTFIG